jgi:hypothetical protein
LRDPLISNGNAGVVVPIPTLPLLARVKYSVVTPLANFEIL